MLLGRTANGIYWMFRYIERAENLVRLLDAGLRMALITTGEASEEWSSVLVSSGEKDVYDALYDHYDGQNVANFILRARENSSSVLSCIENARANARMVRTALTRETWEAVNEAWLKISFVLRKPAKDTNLAKNLDMVKRETAHIRGSLYGTIQRNDVFDFALLGSFIERADNIARLLDVKYYILLPSISYVGSTVDHYQWQSILRSASALQSYLWVYKSDYKAAQVAEHMILNNRMPRSLHFCYQTINHHLQSLAALYGEKAICCDMASEIYEELRNHDINKIIENGLHEFLIDIIKRTNQLSNDIATTYNFI